LAIKRKKSGKARVRPAQPKRPTSKAKPSAAKRAMLAEPPAGLVFDESLLAALVVSSDAGIIAKSLDGLVTSWNAAAERIFGYSAEEIVGKPIELLASPSRPGEMTHILERVRRGERIERHETDNYRF
jgi:PAS domain-containing protein